MSPSIPGGSASLEAEAERLSSALADRFANGNFGARRGGFDHHSRVVRQARARAAAEPAPI